MKQGLFRFYLVVQSKARQAGWMRIRPIWKVSRWIYRQLRCGDVFTISAKGCLWYLDPRDDFFTQGMVLRGFHEEWETPVFLRWLRREMTVVDVGAHVGYYTVLSAQRVGPSGRLIAFEPDSRNRWLLARNLKANDCDNVEIVSDAVSDRCGERQLFLDARNCGGHSLLEIQGGAAYPVTTTTLDKYFESSDTRIDVMKIDVEGAEWLVWKGMQGLLDARRIGRIFIEIWPESLGRFGQTLEAFRGEIADKGFQAFMIDESENRLKEASAADIFQRSQARGYAQVFLVHRSVAQDGFS